MVGHVLRNSDHARGIANEGRWLLEGDVQVVDNRNAQESRGKDLGGLPANQAVVDVQYLKRVCPEESGGPPDVSSIPNQIRPSVMRRPGKPFDPLALQPFYQWATLGYQYDRPETSSVDLSDEVQQCAAGTAPILVSAKEVSYRDAHDLPRLRSSSKN